MRLTKSDKYPHDCVVTGNIGEVVCVGSLGYMI